MSPRSVKKAPVKRRNVEDVPPQTSLALYRRIAVAFVVCVALLLCIVLYVATMQAVIRIVPVEETRSVEFLLDAVATPTKSQEIRGIVSSGRLSRTSTSTPSGQGSKEVEGVSRGTVTITNEGTSPQALVKTTRLLTADAVLFRLEKDVTVPANGTVDVPVYADKPGKSGDIGATHFTIPGLSASLQKLIYADSSTAFVGGFSTVSAVSQSDIDRAVAELRATLEEDGKSMLRAEAGKDLAGESFASTVIEQKVSVEPGAEAASFDVTLTLEETGVFFDLDAVKKIAEQELYATLTPGTAFAEVNLDALQVSVEKVDATSRTGNLRVYLDGRAVSSLTSPELAPGRFAGMSENDVKEMLVADGIAEDVSIEFFPPFVKHVPRLRDHIFVEIK